jgi:hypothetical protein
LDQELITTFLSKEATVVLGWIGASGFKPPQKEYVFLIVAFLKRF